ncbi:cysteine hydrolase family protein [Bacteroidota bacterium]
MKKTILLVLACVACSGMIYSQDTLPKTALVLIDIQGFYFDTSKAPLTGRYEASLQSKLILEHFRESGQEVVHIMHKGGGEIHEYVAPLPGETVFVKEHVSCFRETPLLDYLRGKEVERIVIVGMMTHMCVEAATRASDDLGFETVLIHDACATRDLKFGDEVVAAKDVHLSTLSTLRAYAKVVSAEEFLGE